MPSFSLPKNLGLLQGVALGYPYLFPFGSDQARVFITDNASGQEIWSSATIMKLSADPESEAMRHPLEDGTSFVDHRVVNPLKVTVSMVLTKDVYRDVYASIVNYYKTGLLVDVHSRVGIGKSMALVSYPHEETPDVFDAVPIELNFEQMIFVTPASGTMNSTNTANSTDTNTVQAGQRGLSTTVNSEANQQYIDAGIQGQGRRGPQ